MNVGTLLRTSRPSNDELLFSLMWMRSGRGLGSARLS